MLTTTTTTTKIKIMICGRRRRGKDTLATCLQSFVPSLLRAGFADALKRDSARFLSQFHGIPISVHDTIAQRDRYGPLWQWYGQWCREQFSPDYWVNRFDDEYGDSDRIAVIDCRYFNEAEYGRTHGYTLVRVNGPNRGTEYDTRADDHPSERDVQRLPVHLEYLNTGSIEDMQQWVSSVLLPVATAKHSARKEAA